MLGIGLMVATAASKLVFGCSVVVVVTVPISWADVVVAAILGRELQKSQETLARHRCGIEIFAVVGRGGDGQPQRSKEHSTTQRAQRTDSGGGGGGGGYNGWLREWKLRVASFFG